MTHTFSTTPPKTRKDTDITLGRVGHSTILINFFGTWIITDPIFASAFGMPIPFTGAVIGVRRVRKPSLLITDLPDIDIILLSHAHMDHLHPYAIRRLQKKQTKKIHCITAYGMKHRLPSSVQEHLQELDWTHSTTVADVKITACEVNHRGGRYPWNADRSKGHMHGLAYNAYMLEKNGKTIFFGGDTAYTEAMKSYAPSNGVELAIMPIGSYDPRIHQHCSPEQALEMAAMIGARNIVGIHRDTRGRPAKVREGDKPLQRFLKSAPNYNMNVLRKHEGEVITL